MSAVLSNFDEGFSADQQIAQLRIPPHSMEAESSVLGGLLLDNKSWELVADILSEGVFYRYEHRQVFLGISALINASRPADVITVYEYLQSIGKAEEVGGLGYLNALAQYVPSASNIRRYAEIVRERAILRKLVTASDEIATNAFNTQGKPVPQILDEAEQKIFQIGEEGSRLKQGFQNMDQLAVILMDRVNQMADSPNDITGVPSGFVDFDKMTSGMQAGDLIVLAARPSMGKTALAINIAEHVALNEGLPVAVFSMEMGASQLAIRIVGSIGRIDQQRLRTGKLNQEEWPRLAEAIEKLPRHHLHRDPGNANSRAPCHDHRGSPRDALPAMEDRPQYDRYGWQSNLDTFTRAEPRARTLAAGPARRALRHRWRHQAGCGRSAHCPARRGWRAAAGRNRQHLSARASPASQRMELGSGASAVVGKILKGCP